MNKPSLVLHICCAPDEAWVVNLLKEKYDLYCFFCNPNISPLKEYQLRLEEAKKVAKLFNVPFFSDPYEPDSWEKAITGFENTPEGGERCKRCFILRLQRTAEFCCKMNLPSFTTVMSISPHKQISMLNEAGNIAALKYNLKYQNFDFKKKNGFQQSVILSKKLGLYRQDYCGCRLSIAERNIRIKKQKEKLLKNSSQI